MAVDSAELGEAGRREMSPRLCHYRFGRVSRWSSGWAVAYVSSFKWRRRGSFGWSDAGRAGTLGMATMISADGQSAVTASVVARLLKIPSGEPERTGSTPRSSYGLAGS